MHVDLMALLLQYKYLIMAPAALLFGPIVSLISGFLLRLNYVELVPAYLALAFGELAGDVLWYWLGHRFGDGFVRRFGRFVGINDPVIATAKTLFRRYHDIILFVSKLTAGFGFAPAVLFTAGLARVPFRRYMTLNIGGQIIWTSGLLAIGYFLGNLYLQVNNVLGKISLFALLILLFLALYGFSRYLGGHVKVSPETDGR